MGGSQSTRSVVVENRDTDGAIIITDSVAKRLSGEVEVGRERDTEADKEKLKAQAEAEERTFQIWAREMQRAKRDLERESAVFQTTVKEVEEKFLKQTASPVCQDLQQRVFHCYQDNSKYSLNCSNQVKQFYGCVEHARNNALASKG